MSKALFQYGIYTVWAEEAAAEVEDVEFEAKVCDDGSIELDNGQQHDERRHLKLSPSQARQLAKLIINKEEEER